MRQVFNALPWILPEEHEAVKKLYYKHGRLHRLSKNAVLKCGGECNKLFYLKKGLCMYFVNYGMAKQRVLALIPPGRALGDLTCMSGEIVNVTTVAKRDSEVLVVPPDVLTSNMKSNYEITDAVIKTSIAKQECHMEGLLANFTMPHEERLKILMKALFMSYHIELSGWCTLPLKLSNEELGMITSATRVTVSRTLNKWTEAGFIKKEGRSIMVESSFLNDVYDWHDKKMSDDFRFLSKA